MAFVVKFLCLTATLALSAILHWPISALLADPVILDNRTGLAICEIYLSPAGTDNWSGGCLGGHFLGGHCLEPEQKLKLRLGPSSSNGRRDLRLIFDNGAGRTYFGLDLDSYAYVIAGELEAELFEWDPSRRPGE